ncbi:transcriptional regulator, MucR family [Methylobacterium sp. 4-46]|uniref:MucR family transcriptional regulator n=1 Tax=unclassified Methylobacterium TaxID=2615210 RepID=UPI000152CE95|nr:MULTISPECIES: MucR family transcriptional regulator [Methylobacterium]ACA20213.1 transcriptional regulator, MucR family [Methylobacterium sp. 4-46]WFT79393.1 MucR family transcriptional regulator [Methylobacterium nodulans]
MDSDNQTEFPQSIELVSDIVSAYVSNNSVPVGELAALIRSVHEAVAQLGAPAAPQPEKLVPPVPIKKTVTPDYLISLEDGRRYRTLKRHLAGRGLTPEQYRAKWGLPPDYPMVAANYAAQRSELAKSIGLGQKPVARRPRATQAA